MDLQNYTYDEKNKVLTHKDCYGNFDEYTYDEKGNEIIYKRTENNFIICERITEYDEKGTVIKVYFK